MSSDGDASYRRYRRRILGWGAVVLAIVFAVGAVVSTTRVEDDLERRVVAVLDDAGIAGVTVSFSGQDGQLTCATSLDDGEAIVERAEALRGVRTVELDATCSDGDTSPTAAGPSDPSDTTDGTDAPTGALAVPDQSVLEIVADDPQFSALDQAVTAAGLRALAEPDVTYTAFAPSNEAFEALTPAEAGALNADPALFAAVLQNHVLPDVVMLDDLQPGAIEMLGGEELEVERTASGDVTLTSGDVTATVVEGDIEATDGVLHIVDRLLVPVGLDLEAGRGSTTTTSAPADDTSTDSTTSDPVARAESLQLDLDGIVADTRIGFPPGGTEVSPLSGPTLDRVAEAIIARPGLQVVVEGHTDSDGSDLANLFVSTARASSVVDALVARDVPAGRLVAVGLGATEPVVVDGVEDPVASRRVVFVVQDD